MRRQNDQYGYYPHATQWHSHVIGFLTSAKPRTPSVRLPERSIFIGVEKAQKLFDVLL